MPQLQTLKGFRDFLPEQALKRQWLRNKMIEVFERWGYVPLETPTLEPLSLFAGEIGEDEKLFFKFTDQGGRQVALRYDQTVPTCRVVGQYNQQLVMPFKRYQIQPAFRAENTQKGRYREFVQADIDIIGIASPLADAEAIAVSLDLYKSIGFKDAFVLVNNRDLMKDIPYTAIVAIDKLKKIGKDGVIAEMIGKGIPENKAKEYFDYVADLKPDAIVNTIFNYLKESGFSVDSYKFEPTLARSFSYSQGPIWEMVIPGYLSGSVGGGERYDGLLERITGIKIPGTGIAFGFDRTLEAAEQFGLIPTIKSPTKILVTIFSPELFNNSLKTAKMIRTQGISTEIFPDDQAKLNAQLKYADRKGIPYVIIAGPDEVAKNVVKLKNMQTQEQEEVSVEQVIEKLK